MPHNGQASAQELATSLTCELPPRAAGDFLYIGELAPTGHAHSGFPRIGPLSAEAWKGKLEFAMSDAGQVGSQSALPGTAQGDSGFYMNKDLDVAHYVLEDGDWKQGHLAALCFPPALASLWEDAQDRHRGGISVTARAEQRNWGEAQGETEAEWVARSLDKELLPVES